MIPAVQHAVYTIRAVLFDLDRTLLDRDAALDAYARWLWNEAGTGDGDKGLDFARRFAELDARGKTDKYVYFRTLRNEFRLSVELQDMLDRFENNFPSTVRPFPGALEVLETLRADGLRCGVITNGHSRGQREKLQQSGFASLLDTVVISKEVGVAKPDPRIFQIALRALGFRHNEVLFVGDSESADIAGAANAGIRSVLLRHPGESFPSAADYEVSELAGVLAVVASCNRDAPVSDRRRLRSA